VAGQADARGIWEAKDVAAIGDPAKIPLPVEFRSRPMRRGLWVNTFMDGTTHYFDLTDPEHPRQTYAKHTGSQVNMVSQKLGRAPRLPHLELLSKWTRRARRTSSSARIPFGTAMSFTGVEVTSPRNSSAVPIT